MSAALKIYLDSSVPSAYWDATKLQRQQETRTFWDAIPQYDVHVSTAVLQEIQQTPDNDLMARLLGLVHQFSVLDSEQIEVQMPAQAYIQYDIFPARFELDAIHVATTSVHQLDALVSWNFHHLVKLSKERAVNEVNQELGHAPIDIVSPTML